MNATTNDSDLAEKVVTEGACFHSDSQPEKVVRVTAYCLLILCSLVGNSLVIMVVHRNRRMWKTVNFFIVNTSAAYLVMTFVYMPRVISLSYAGYEWLITGTLGLFFCKAVCLNEVSITVSIFTIVAISVDRFFAVVFPFRRYITTRICKIIILFIWLTAFSAASPQFYGLEIRSFEGKNYCYLDLDKTFGHGSEKAFYTFAITTIFGVPLALLLFLYSGIAVALLKRRNILRNRMFQNEFWFQRRERTRKKVLKMVAIVVATFVLCWLLYFLNFVFHSEGIILPCQMMFFRLFLAHFYCAANPIIYWRFSGNFRQGFSHIIPSPVSQPNQSGQFDLYRKRTVIPDVKRTIADLNNAIKSELHTLEIPNRTINMPQSNNNSELQVEKQRSISERENRHATST